MSFPILIHSPIEAFHIDQVGLSEALPFPLDETCLMFQLIQKLNGLLVAAVHALRDLRDGEDDIDAILIIPPAVPVRKLSPVKQDAVQQLCFGRDSLEGIILKQDLRDPEK